MHVDKQSTKETVYNLENKDLIGPNDLVNASRSMQLTSNELYNAINE